MSNYSIQRELTNVIKLNTYMNNRISNVFINARFQNLKFPILHNP